MLPFLSDKMSKGAGVVNVVEMEGDLLEAKEEYLCHQCNCVTVRGAHLSGSVFARFPHADIYKERIGRQPARDEPGNIVVRGGAEGERLVINMLGQFYPGKARFANDTGVLRRGWFQSCLDRITDLATKSPIRSLAFPERIGCGAAGGDWDRYKAIIIHFARQNPSVAVAIYSLPQTKK